MHAPVLDRTREFFELLESPSVFARFGQYSTVYCRTAPEQSQLSNGARKTDFSSAGRRVIETGLLGLDPLSRIVAGTSGGLFSSFDVGTKSFAAASRRIAFGSD